MSRINSHANKKYSKQYVFLKLKLHKAPLNSVQIPRYNFEFTGCNNVGTTI